jgi:DNA-binding MarR family transcriptional regulator
MCGEEMKTIATAEVRRQAASGAELIMGDNRLALCKTVTEETKKVEREGIGFCVRKLNRMVTAIYDGALASAGLKTSQFSVLVAVANREKARPAELTRLLQMDESTLSRNVERMCAKSWLRLKPDEDRRSHLIEVTDKGRALIRKCLPAWQRAQEEVSQRLGTDNVAGLRSALRELSA